MTKTTTRTTTTATTPTTDSLFGPKVVDIMGTNINMYHCPCIVTPATGEDPPTDYESLPPFGYHQVRPRLCAA